MFARLKTAYVAAATVETAPTVTASPPDRLTYFREGSMHILGKASPKTMSKIKFGFERTTPAAMGIGMSQTRMGELMPPVKRLVQATQAVIVKVKSQPSHVGAAVLDGAQEGQDADESEDQRASGGAISVHRRQDGSEQWAEERRDCEGAQSLLPLLEVALLPRGVEVETCLGNCGHNVSIVGDPHRM